MVCSGLRCRRHEPAYIWVGRLGHLWLMESTSRKLAHQVRVVDVDWPSIASGIDLLVVVGQFR